MDERLVSLIEDYLQAVRKALELIYKSGITLPHTSGDWLEKDLSHLTMLDGNIAYQKHGYGCIVYLADGVVDFDFGRCGEISGIDAWRLTQFAKHRPKSYGFMDDKELYECFDEAVNRKFMIPLDMGMYRLASQPLEYATSIYSIKDGDLLPHREQDKVITLHVHYFYAADLMFTQYESLLSKWDKNKKLSRNDEINLRIYMTSWLGYLAVTCAGYKDLNMYLLISKKRPVEYKELIPKCNELNSAIKRHFHDLRKFRNNVFHLRTSIEDTMAFLSPVTNRISWARSIHSDLKSFFSDYRVACECHYLLNGRQNESEVWVKNK